MDWKEERRLRWWYGAQVMKQSPSGSPGWMGSARAALSGARRLWVLCKLCNPACETDASSTQNVNTRHQKCLTACMRCRPRNSPLRFDGLRLLWWNCTPIPSKRIKFQRDGGPPRFPRVAENFSISRLLFWYRTMFWHQILNWLFIINSKSNN